MCLRLVRLHCACQAPETLRTAAGDQQCRTLEWLLGQEDVVIAEVRADGSAPLQGPGHDPGGTSTLEAVTPHAGGTAGTSVDEGADLRQDLVLGQGQENVYRWAPVLRAASAASSTQQVNAHELTGTAGRSESNRVAVGSWNSGAFRPGCQTEAFRGGAYHIALAQACPTPQCTPRITGGPLLTVALLLPACHAWGAMAASHRPPSQQGGQGRCTLGALLTCARVSLCVSRTL